MQGISSNPWAGCSGTDAAHHRCAGLCTLPLTPVFSDPAAPTSNNQKKSPNPPPQQPPRDADECHPLSLPRLAQGRISLSRDPPTLLNITLKVFYRRNNSARSKARSLPGKDAAAVSAAERVGSTSVAAGTPTFRGVWLGWEGRSVCCEPRLPRSLSCLLSSSLLPPPLEPTSLPALVPISRQR